MPASPARVEANRLNSQRSTGPSRSASGTGRSRRNAIEHGLTGAGTALPGAITARVQGFELALRAEYAVGEGDAVGHFLVAQAALAMARLEVAPTVEWDLRRDQIDRAEHSWEIDRLLDAAELGDRLARKPDVVAPRLLQSARGCDWLIGRWDLLARSIEAAGACDDAHRRMLADLLGLPAGLRDADPRLSPDRPASELAALAREERDAVARLKAEVLDPLDDRDRERTLAGLTFDESPAARRLRGYEAACDRRLRWATDQLRRRRAAAGPIPAAPPSSLSWPTAINPDPAPPAVATPPASPSLVAAASLPGDSPAGSPTPKTNPTTPPRPDRTPAEAGPPPAVSPASGPRPIAAPPEKRTQPALAPRPMAPADRPILLNNRRSRRAAAARLRRAG